MELYKYTTKIDKKHKNFDLITLEKQSMNLKDLRKKKISNPWDLFTIARALEVHKETEEVFIMFTLDTKLQVSGMFEISRGSLSSSIVHPREVFKKALITNADAIMLMHNHPSGIPKPSSEDITVTKKLIEVGELIGIDVLEHIIIGDGMYYSFKEEGKI